MGDLAAVGAEPLAEPEHGPDRQAGGGPDLLDQPGLGRQPVVLHGADQLDAVRPARLRPFRVGGVPGDDLEQAAHEALSAP